MSKYDYRGCELVSSVLLHLHVVHATTANQQLAHFVLLLLEGCIHNALSLLIPQELKQYALLLDRASFFTEQLQWFFVALAEQGNGGLLERLVLAGKHLAGVALAAQVDHLGLHLVGDVGQQHVEVVV
jgi:hypothetical protein